jgi:hypothetical protein
LHIPKLAIDHHRHHSAWIHGNTGALDCTRWELVVGFAPYQRGPGFAILPIGRGLYQSLPSLGSMEGDLQLRITFSGSSNARIPVPELPDDGTLLYCGLDRKQPDLTVTVEAYSPTSAWAC